MPTSHALARTTDPNSAPGPEGPAFASKNFRAAAPDLSVGVVKMIVANDSVTVHMQFRGHFTGSFGKTKGNVTDNWHIEDNLTLLTKMGVASVAQ
jgi:hypothetical protein